MTRERETVDAPAYAAPTRSVPRNERTLFVRSAFAAFDFNLSVRVVALPAFTDRVSVPATRERPSPSRRATDFATTSRAVTRQSARQMTLNRTPDRFADFGSVSDGRAGGGVTVGSGVGMTGTAVAVGTGDVEGVGVGVSVSTGGGVTVTDPAGPA